MVITILGGYIYESKIQIRLLFDGGYLFYRITKNRDPLLQYKIAGLLRKRDRVNHANTSASGVP